MTAAIAAAAVAAAVWLTVAAVARACDLAARIGRYRSLRRVYRTSSRGAVWRHAGRP